MPLKLDDVLVVAITSRALFDLHESAQIYDEDGLDAYRAHQLEREDEPLEPGTGFPLARGLLSINKRAGEHLVEVVILSRNDGDSGLRIMNSINTTGSTSPEPRSGAAKIPGTSSSPSAVTCSSPPKPPR